MKRLFPFLKTTLMGGLLVLLPLCLMALLIAKAVGIIKALVAPVVAQLPDQLHHPTVIAVLLLLALCFLTGLIMRTAVGRSIAGAIESQFLNRIPGYTFIRSLTNRFAGTEGGEPFTSALAVIEDALVPAFVVEHHEDGRYTVFVPSSPTPGVGSVYILPKERVHLVDVPLLRAARCVSQWGVGSGELLRAMRDAEQRKITSPRLEAPIE
jgi:uncharacterized membrane protein